MSGGSNDVGMSISWHQVRLVIFLLPRAHHDSTTASKLSFPQTVFAPFLPLAVHAEGTAAALSAPCLHLAVHADGAAAALSAGALVPPVRAEGTLLNTPHGRRHWATCPCRRAALLTPLLRRRTLFPPCPWQRRCTLYRCVCPCRARRWRCRRTLCTVAVTLGEALSKLRNLIFEPQFSKIHT